ncbi:MAG: DNA cytosine methyltransferase, partial [Chloroflexi bacterium]|nr:DNA cytosine methyltransferase [Chloroflexota bacterium]
MNVSLTTPSGAPSTQTSGNALISLFSGAGGLDLGLEMAGFSTRIAVELDGDARQTLKDNQRRFWSSQFPIFEDVTALDPQFILDQAGLEPGEAVLVAGGPPCQSFSTAGNRQSLGDPRGSLFKNFADVIEIARPRFFVMENVRGILSAAIKHRPLIERGSDFPPLTIE